MCSPSIPDDVPFSLTCSECDDGMSIETYPEALALGWTDIRYDPDLYSANFIGLCPECKTLLEEEQRKEWREAGLPDEAE